MVQSVIPFGVKCDQPILHHTTQKQGCIYLGGYCQGSGGLDMIAEDDTAKLMKWLTDVDAQVIVAEGERLMRLDLLSHLSANFDLHIFCVDVAGEGAADRRKSRAGSWDRFVSTTRIQEQADRLQVVRDNYQVHNLDGTACAHIVAKEFQAELVPLGIVFKDDPEDSVDLLLDGISSRYTMDKIRIAVELDNALYPKTDLLPLIHKGPMFEKWLEVATAVSSEGEAMKAKALRIRSFLKLPSDQREHILSRQYFVVVGDVVFTDACDIGHAATKRKAEPDEVVEMLDGPNVDEQTQLTRIRGKSLADDLVGWITVKSNQDTAYLKPVAISTSGPLSLQKAAADLDPAAKKAIAELQETSKDELLERLRCLKAAWIFGGRPLGQRWLSDNVNKTTLIGHLLVGLAAAKAEKVPLAEELEKALLAKDFNFKSSMRRFKLNWEEAKKRLQKENVRAGAKKAKQSKEAELR